MEINDLNEYHKQFIALDGNVYTRGPIKKLDNDIIKEINLIYKTKNIIEAFYISIHGKSFCNICQTKYPVFKGYLRGYKNTCDKCNHLNQNSLRNVFIICMNHLSDKAKENLKLSHFKWIKYMYKNYSKKDNIFEIFKNRYLNIFIELNYTFSNKELYKKIIEIQSFGTGHSKQKYVAIYGENEGIVRYLLWKENQKGKSSLEKFILEYGEVDGRYRYQELCKRKDSGSLSFFISKYGEIIGPEKYKDFCNFQKINATKEFMVERYGEVEGTLKFENMKKNAKEKNSASLLYWLKLGYSKEDAKKFQSNRQITFTKEKCIEKYGEEKGLQRWKDRQFKWQQSLSLKSDEELLSINKRKNSAFSWIKEYFNYNNEETIKLLDSIDKEKFRLYTKEIFKLSNLVYIEFIDEIDKDRLRGRTENGLYHLDHRFSRMMGYLLNVPIEVMACKYNLEILNANYNIIKSSKCSITLEDLYANYNSSIKGKI